MSWFSELTNKAEALLERLDQDAAQALQNPENILKNNRILDQAKKNFDHIVGQSERDSLISYNHVESDIPSSQTFATTELHVDTSNQELDRQDDNGRSEQDTSHHVQTNSLQLTPNEKINEGKLPSKGENHTEIKTVNSDGVPRSKPTRVQAPSEIGEQTIQTQTSTSHYEKRRFKFQSSKLGLNKSRVVQDKVDLARSEVNNFPQAPIARDIRESINQSLKNYANSSDAQIRTHTAQASFYDDQPNLIRDYSEQDKTKWGESSDSRLKDKRNDSSGSFSIDFPEHPIGGHSDIASQILKQSALKRKSTFNLKQVINRIAIQDGYSFTIFDEKTRARLRRGQMRAASYMRRLNYYFRVYPKLKYWMIVYLIVLQMLVVYVLFFYQTTSSSTYLSSQVKEQEEAGFELLHHLKDNHGQHARIPHQNVN